jgi:hypothetical protein
MTQFERTTPVKGKKGRTEVIREQLFQPADHPPNTPCTADTSMPGLALGE